MYQNDFHHVSSESPQWSTLSNDAIIKENSPPPSKKKQQKGNGSIWSIERCVSCPPPQRKKLSEYQIAQADLFFYQITPLKLCSWKSSTRLAGEHENVYILNKIKINFSRFMFCKFCKFSTFSFFFFSFLRCQKEENVLH